MQSFKHFPKTRVSESKFRPTIWPAPARDKLEALVHRYGCNSTSYVLLEGSWKYFTTPGIDGFLAYQLSAGVAVIGGDPVCSPGQAPTLLKHFIAQMNGRPVSAYQVSRNMLAAFVKAGFSHIQIGKEAIIDLNEFTLAGGKMELVRAATNKAKREGIVVSEHFPFAIGSQTLNQELCEISDEWLRTRGEHEFGFLLGSLNLEQRSAKRYFVARSEQGLGRIEGFIVCEPIYGRNGYYLDVTRRRTDAVRGTMELLTTEIFGTLFAEGYEMASMGLAPLALLDDPDLEVHVLLARLMRLIYQRARSNYDFKLLYRYKAKYHPQVWEPRYLCFSSKRLDLRIVYAVIQVRKGNLVGSFFKNRNKSTQGIRETLQSWKHIASFIIAFCAALFSS